ncbi:MAG: post-translational modification of quorum-sensing peptide protein [Thermobacillus sp. ZCTH02-B1]|uniref:accessory gene regulator ArgB-like protein n=1 Tax=Thermobacillus sp. ZCTH02-B1 TaxID=1858795 RepID=UPI000B561A45|nr:accessory gene regulator B family protein [Thermobacillus sp. ZCTH02-B1]OUM94675.1 MAG: post-translational modification of quorum-sensing peptide protein [Thermobacillus sp. ZCTH02-B1]
MVERLAFRLAHWLKSEVPDHPYSVARLQFGFHLFLNTVLTLLVATILGLLFDNLRETMQVLFAFGLLRMISGGYHLKSASVCIVASAGVAALLPFVELSVFYITLLNIANMVLTIIFAPSRIEEQTRIPSKYFPALKVASTVLVASNFLFQSQLLAITWFIQAISLIRFPKKGGDSV